MSTVKEAMKRVVPVPLPTHNNVTPNSHRQQQQKRPAIKQKPKWLRKLKFWRSESDGSPITIDEEFDDTTTSAAGVTETKPATVIFRKSVGRRSATAAAAAAAEAPTRRWSSVFCGGDGEVALEEKTANDAFILTGGRRLTLLSEVPHSVRRSETGELERRLKAFNDLEKSLLEHMEYISASQQDLSKKLEARRTARQSAMIVSYIKLERSIGQLSKLEKVPTHQAEMTSAREQDLNKISGELGTAAARQSDITGRLGCRGPETPEDARANQCLVSHDEQAVEATQMKRRLKAGQAPATDADNPENWTSGRIDTMFFYSKIISV